MKYLYFLVCVAVVQGFVAENSRVERVSELDTPSFQKTQLYDPANVNLTWTEVKSDDPRDPVLGYKLRVWERPNVITYKYKIINGVKTLVEDIEPSEPKNNNIPKGKPTEYITDKNTYSMGGLKINVWYEFSVLAFTNTRESKGSATVSVKINPPENSDKDFYMIV